MLINKKTITERIYRKQVYNLSRKKIKLPSTCQIIKSFSAYAHLIRRRYVPCLNLLGPSSLQFTSLSGSKPRSMHPKNWTRV